MKKWVVFLTVWVVFAGSALGAFQTNAVTRTIDIDALSSDFGDFFWEWNGYEDVKATITLTNSSGYVTLTGYYGLFRVSRRTTGGSTSNYIDKGTSAVTISGYTMQVTIDKTELESMPDDTYLAQWLLLDSATTNTTLSVGRGKVRLTESLYDDD